MKYHAKLNLQVTFTKADHEISGGHWPQCTCCHTLYIKFVWSKKHLLTKNMSENFLSVQLLELNLPYRTDLIFLCNPLRDHLIRNYDTSLDLASYFSSWDALLSNVTEEGIELQNCQRQNCILQSTCTPLALWSILFFQRTLHSIRQIINEY